MAAKINAGEIVRSELLFIDPAEVIVSNNSRWKIFDESKVARMLVSFERTGQLQPVQVRKLHDGRVSLVFGFHRHEAAVRYNAKYPAMPMKLQCRLVDCNEEEAFERSIVENHVRSKASPMDDAHAQRRLREQYGWTDARISDLYGCAHSQVSAFKRLLSLSSETQELIHSGVLTVKAALDAVALPSETQTEIIRDSIAEVEADESSRAHEEANPVDEPNPTLFATEPTPPAKPQTVPLKRKREAVSRKVSGRAREAKVAVGDHQRRTMSEVRCFFEEMESESSTVTSLSSLMLQYLRGEIIDSKMQESLEFLLGD